VETLTEAIERLRGKGFLSDFSAVTGAKLRCEQCGSEFDPSELHIDEIVRFEGTSDPGDESILFALSGPCGHAGLYSTAYGPNATPEDAAVVAVLHR
jgi:hypothetical protein